MKRLFLITPFLFFSCSQDEDQELEIPALELSAQVEYVYNTEDTNALVEVHIQVLPETYYDSALTVELVNSQDQVVLENVLSYENGMHTGTLSTDYLSLPNGEYRVEIEGTSYSEPVTIQKQLIILFLGSEQSDEGIAYSYGVQGNNDQEVVVDDTLAFWLEVQTLVDVCNSGEISYVLSEGEIILQNNEHEFSSVIAYPSVDISDRDVEFVLTLPEYGMTDEQIVHTLPEEGCEMNISFTPFFSIFDVSMSGNNRKADFVFSLENESGEEVFGFTYQLCEFIQQDTFSLPREEGQGTYTLFITSGEYPLCTWEFTYVNE